MNDTMKTNGEEKAWRRRGLFAAAAALLAAVAGKVTEQRVEAGTDGDVVLGGVNQATNPTFITLTTTPLSAVDNAAIIADAHFSVDGAV